MLKAKCIQSPLPVLIALLAWTTAASADDATGLLTAEFARLEALSGGTMGVAAIHLETGRSAYLNPREAYPMASSYKVPIAVCLLQRVDAGEIDLTDMVDIKPSNLSPGSGTISKLFDDPGVSISVHNLLELMLLISDNSATDMCLELAGGGEAVTNCMKALGIEDVRVDRSTLLLIADYIGVNDLPPDEERTPQSFQTRSEKLSDEDRRVAAKAFAADPRDCAAPEGMAKLLELIWTNAALSKENCELLRDIMRRCETGAARIPGRLPQGTPVGHKTGTIGGTTNDVGVITLPHNAGHVILVAFVKDSTAPIPEREAAIAEVARAAHDFFLFNRE